MRSTIMDNSLSVLASQNSDRRTDFNFPFSPFRIRSGGHGRGRLEPDSTRVDGRTLRLGEHPRWRPGTFFTLP